MISRVDDLRGRVAPDVFGHETSRSAVELALKNDRLPHAVLLVGPTGVGKYKFARGVARALLCARPTDRGGSCEDCPSCRSVESGNHPGFGEIRPESGKRIDIQSVRDVTAELSVRQEGRRVVIIDTADAMSAESANAFLKTLEEPPPGILFLLVSSASGRMLPTILSRCWKMPFGTLARADFDAALEASGQTIEEDVAELFARSGGSPGRALELDRGIAEAGGAEALESLFENAGQVSPDSLLGFVPARDKEPKRDRVRRLVELARTALWATRRASGVGDPLVRAELVARLDELSAELDSNVHPELILEALGRELATARG